MSKERDHVRRLLGRDGTTQTRTAPRAGVQTRAAAAGSTSPEAPSGAELVRILDALALDDSASWANIAEGVETMATTLAELQAGAEEQASEAKKARRAVGAQALSRTTVVEAFRRAIADGRISAGKVRLP